MFGFGKWAVKASQDHDHARKRGHDLEFHPLGNVGFQIVHLHALLLHGVAVADGNGAGLFGLEVHADAERRADLVLTAVALADGAGLVVVHRELSDSFS